jgi:hypothetical protein
MGKASRDKGARNERNIVSDLRAAGVIAAKVPLSGAVGGQFSGDILVQNMLRFEAKVRSDGFRELYKWIDGNYGLFVKADRQPTLTVLRLQDFAKLLLYTLKPNG